MIHTIQGADAGRRARVAPPVPAAAGAWSRLPRRRLGTAEPICAAPTCAAPICATPTWATPARAAPTCAAWAPLASLSARMLRESAASPRGRLVAGCVVAAAVQMVVALSLLSLAPHAAPDPPAPPALQIAMLPPPPVAPAAEAALRDVAPPGPTPPEPMPPNPAVPDTAVVPPEPSSVQSLLAPPPAAAPDATPAAPEELLPVPALPAVPRTVHRTARLADPVRLPVRAVPRAAASRPAIVASGASAADAPAPQPAFAAAAPAAPSRAGLDSYEGRLKSAIQAALRYPPAAAMMGRDGRARVAFSISDARAADIRLLRGTGSSQLDEAALAAVRQAAYPRPPAEIGARSMAMLVWVEFSRPDTEE